MSNLVAIAYPDQATAEEVMGTLGRLSDRASRSSSKTRSS